MRCNECGWDNDPGTNKCLKCGNPLQGAASVNNPYQDVSVPIHDKVDTGGRMPRPTVVDSSAFRKEVQDSTPRPTVMSHSLEGGIIKEKTHIAHPTVKVTDSMIHVNVNDTKDAQRICPNCQTEVSSKFLFCPMCGERMPIIKGPQCSLTMILDEDEDGEARINDYEGETIVLKRDNTEPSNRTITSKEQAVLICEEDKWYLENRSEQCSTYLEANRRLEIMSDDVIMLGDRRFKFTVNQK